jgi:hypothetical protein
MPSRGGEGKKVDGYPNRVHYGGKLKELEEEEAGE